MQSAKFKYVYIAFNPAMPGWVKFGQTKDIQKRLNQLSGSSPVPFVVLHKIKVVDKLAWKIETAIKKEFNEFKGLYRTSLRSPEWIYYNKDSDFICSRYELVSWIKSIIRTNLLNFHAEIGNRYCSAYRTKKDMNHAWKLRMAAVAEKQQPA
jgi:hypothetical protein